MSGAKWRWHVAHLLRRSRRLCWADTVTWALGWHPLARGDDSLRVRSQSMGCAEEASRVGCCWCSKFCTAEFAQQAGTRGPIIVSASTEEQA